MKTAMQNLILEVENLTKIGIITKDCSDAIKNYIKHIGYREEECNIKMAWIDASISTKTGKVTTEQDYYEKMYGSRTTV